MSNKHAGQKKFTLRFSLGTAFVGVVVLTSLLLGMITFVSVSAFVRQSVRERLGDAAGIAALGIDGEPHATLRSPDDEKSAAYKALQTQLRMIRGKSKDIRFVYTARKDESGRIVFVVDAEEDPKEISHLGDVYDKATKDMLAAFEKPYATHIDRSFHTDEWGTFLSSYAPILRRNGELEAVLGMDITAQKVVEYENRYLLTILCVCLAGSFLVMLVGALHLAAHKQATHASGVGYVADTEP